MAKGAYIGVDEKARKIKKGYIGIETFEKKPLPSGYTQVEYVQSNGTQYINTGFKPNNNTRVVVDFENTGDYSGMTTSLCPFFGARNGSSSAVFALWIGTKTFPQYGDVAYNKNGNFTVNLNTRLIYDFNKNVVTIGDTTITCASATFTTSYEMCLLTINNYGTIENRRASGKLYSCKIYDNSTLVRDYVPCKNSSGAVGLYDVVNGKFYTNAGTGTFTAGTDKQSAARKIKKAYIGIGGVARPCWSGGELAYYGEITPLPETLKSPWSMSVGNYALFCGGLQGNTGTTNVDYHAYDNKLTRTKPAQHYNQMESVSTGRVGNYGLAAGGIQYAEEDILFKSVQVIDTKLTKTSTTLSGYRAGIGCAELSNYVLFGGGFISNGYASTVDAFDTSLTRKTATALPYSSTNHIGGNVDGYGLFWRTGTNTGECYAYNSSLVQSTITSYGASLGSAITVSLPNHCVVAQGGQGTTVKVYDTNLTLTSVTAFPAKVALLGTPLGELALFINDNRSSPMTMYGRAYDDNLTQTIIPDYSPLRDSKAFETVGNYAILAGGYLSDTGYMATANAYTIN